MSETDPIFLSEKLEENALRPDQPMADAQFVERVVTIYRRAIASRGREKVFSSIAQDLAGAQDLSVRQIKVHGSRTPIIQLLKQQEGKIRLDIHIETADDIIDGIFDAVPSLTRETTVHFDHVQTVGKSTKFVVAKPSSIGSGPIYGERMGVFNFLQDRLLMPPDQIRMRRTPDLTVVYLGPLATEQTAELAEEAVKAHLPFYVDFADALVDVSLPSQKS